MLNNINVLQVMTVAVAGVWAFMLTQWIQFIREFLAIKKDLLPEGADLSDRETVVKLAASLEGRGQLRSRLKSLLEFWSRGASRTDIAGLSAAQSGRALARAGAGLVFSALVLAGGLTQPALQNFAATGLGVAGATLFLYLLVLGRIDACLERQLLGRLPGEIAGLKITADELARALGGAIEKAFRDYMPQPEKLAAATTGAVEATLKSAAGSLDAVHKRLLDVQEGLATKFAALQKESAASMEAALKKQADGNDALAAKWAAAQKEVVALMESAQKKQVEAGDAQTAKLAAGQKEAITALGAAHQKFLDAGQALAEKQSGHQKETVLSLEAAKKAMDAVAAQLQTNLAGTTEKWQAALQAHAQQLSAANQALVAQLEKIQTMGKDIEKVLHIQQTVDNTIKSVTTTEDFRNTLATLKSHLEKSDNLLREVTKPRSIRLVESNPEAV